MILTFPSGKAVTLRYTIQQFTLRDWKELEQDGIVFATLNDGVPPSKLSRVLFQLVRMSDSNITHAEIDSLQLKDVKAVMAFAGQAEPIDRPT